MSWISEAHNQWHAINGPYGCPLDCGIGEDEAEAAYLATLPAPEYTEPFIPTPLPAVPF